MKRRVVELGGTTLVISLPSKWAKRFGIKKGSEVDVEDTGSKLQVNPQVGPKKIRKSVHLSSGTEVFGRLFITPYKFGYDEIEVSSDDNLDYAKIMSATDEVLGFEIVKQSPKRCLVKNVAAPLHEEFDELINRVFIITLSMAKECFAAMKEPDETALNGIILMEKTNNKFTNLCERILNVFGYKEHQKIPYLYGIVLQLEQIADNIRDICVVLKTKKVQKETLEIFKGLLDYFDAVYSQFNKLRNEQFKMLKDNRKNLQTKIKNEINADPMILAYLNGILHRLEHIEVSLVPLDTN